MNILTFSFLARVISPSKRVGRGGSFHDLSLSWSKARSRVGVGVGVAARAGVGVRLGGGVGVGVGLGRGVPASCPRDPSGRDDDPSIRS